jgi:PAS domain S-box-containing protein
MVWHPFLLEQILELGQIGLGQLDLDGRIVSANAAFLGRLHLDRVDPHAPPMSELISSKDAPPLTQALTHAAATGRTSVQLKYTGGGSHSRYQALTILRAMDAEGKPSGFCCLLCDADGSQRPEATLSVAKESPPSGYLIVVRDGRIESANRAAEELFGYDPDELIGNPIEILLPVRFRDSHLGLSQHFVANDSSRDMSGRDLWGLRKDGVEIPLQIYVNRISTEGGGFLVCTILDISDRPRYQNQLEEAKQAADSANRAKSEFLARVSHEIRTPMNLIMGMNALLLESPLTEKQRHHVEISYRNVRRLLRLINGILDLSKIESGNFSMRDAPFDLLGALRESIATIDSAAEQKGLQLSLSIDPDVWPYWIGDSERLQQVLLNLVGNAVKFTSCGGVEVRVHADQSEDGRSGIRVEVLDTGCGVPPDKAALIFEPFHQAEGSISRSFEGTGLGLAIARSIVEMMNGRIWLDTTAGPGAKFDFTAYFTRATEHDVLTETRPICPAKLAATIEAGSRVLVVEDNPENVILIQAYLENLGLALEVAENGMEAVRMRQSSNYDLVLMDIQMPVMDGHAATREIREWETKRGLARVPIVALTAHAVHGASVESHEAGCDDHLTKPVERNTLINTIARYVKRPVSADTRLRANILERRPTFLAKRRIDLANMHEALIAGDYSAIRTIGHNCRGIGTGYGFPHISELGSRIEVAARNNSQSDLREFLKQFEDYLDHVSSTRPNVPPKGSQTAHTRVAAS